MCIAQEKSTRQMVADGSIKDPNPNPTIRELLLAGKIEKNKWYWVQENPYVNITAKVNNAPWPLQYRKYAKAGDIRYLVNNRINPDIHSVYKVQSWLAYMFDFIEQTNEVVLARTVALAHHPKPVDIDKSVFNLNSKDEGIYFFKQLPGQQQMSEISYEDLPFLREYYQVEIAKNAETKQLEYNISKNITKVLRYELFEYYPSGALQRISTVKPGQYDTLTNAFYFVGTEEYTDHYKKPKLIKPYSNTKLYDKTHPYWLDDILHD